MLNAIHFFYADLANHIHMSIFTYAVLSSCM